MLLVLDSCEHLIEDDRSIGAGAASSGRRRRGPYPGDEAGNRCRVEGEQVHRLDSIGPSLPDDESFDGHLRASPFRPCSCLFERAAAKGRRFFELNDARRADRRQRSAASSTELPLHSKLAAGARRFVYGNQWDCVAPRWPMQVAVAKGRAHGVYPGIRRYGAHARLELQSAP